VPTVIISADSTVLFWNAAAENLLGWSSGEVLEHPLPTVPPDRMDEHIRLRDRTMDGEGFSQHRVMRLTKDGTPIELSLSTWPIRGVDGHVAALIGVIVSTGAEDLRFRQSLVNKQLAELERLYPTTPIGLGFLDTNLRYLRVNEPCAGQRCIHRSPHRQARGWHGTGGCGIS